MEAAESAHKAASKRPLPEDPAELDKLTAPYRILVRPVVSGISHGLEAFDVKGLDADEKESGTEAFACLLYQYGAQVDARLLVVLWAFGIAAPRLAEVAQKKQKRRVNAPPRAEKEVGGERVTPFPQE